MSTRPYGRWTGIARNMSAVDADDDLREEGVRSRVSAPSIMTADPLASRDDAAANKKNDTRETDRSEPLKLKKDVGPSAANDEDDVRAVEHALGTTGHMDLKKTGGTTGLFGASLQQGIERLQSETGLKKDGMLKPNGPTATLIGGVLTALGAALQPKRSRTSKRLTAEQSSSNARLVSHLKRTAEDGMVPSLYASAFAGDDNGKAETVDFMRQLQHSDAARAPKMRAAIEARLTERQKADFGDWVAEAEQEADPASGIDAAQREKVMQTFAASLRNTEEAPEGDAQPTTPAEGDQPEERKPDEDKSGKPKSEKEKRNCNKREIALYELSQAWNKAGKRDSLARLRLETAQKALENHRENGLKRRPQAPPNTYEKKQPPVPPKRGKKGKKNAIDLLEQFLTPKNIAGGMSDAMSIEEAQDIASVYRDKLKRLEADVAEATEEARVAKKAFDDVREEHVIAVRDLKLCQEGKVPDG